MRERWVIAIAACYIVLLCASLFVSLYIAQEVTNRITEQTTQTRRTYLPPWSTPDINFTFRNVTVFHQDDRLYQGDNKPYVVTTGLTAQDYWSNTSSILRIRGTVNNTGGGTAYEGVLHVVAMNSEGAAVDADKSFAMTGHMRLMFDFSLPYNGSAIINCTITPFYLDRASLPNRP